VAAYSSHGRLYLSLSLEGRRASLTLHPSCATDRGRADARDQVVRQLVAKLTDAGQEKFAPKIARLAAAASDGELAEIRAYVETVLCAGLRRLRSEVLTVRQFGERWTSGELARQYPDHLRAKDSADTDRRRLEKYVYPHLGAVPLTVVGLEELEAVMGALPSHLGPVSRRQVAQVLARLFRLAHYPAKLIESSPVPDRFLPRVPRGPAFTLLYPAEEAQLLACTLIPLWRRLLHGVIAREMLRPLEGTGLLWSQLDLDVGSITLSEHKTVKSTGARTWRLDPGVRAALCWWRSLLPESSRPSVFPPTAGHKLAARLRADLLLAGVTRAELHQSTDHQRQLRAHDLRATGATIALANGQTETFVMDRTGHTSSIMVQRYRRVARRAAELDLGPLAPLWWALPECRAAYDELMTRPVIRPRPYAVRMRPLEVGGKPVENVGNGEGFAVISPGEEDLKNRPNPGGEVVSISARIRPAYDPFEPGAGQVPDPPRDPHPLYLRLVVVTTNRKAAGDRRGLPSPHPLQSPSLVALARLRRAA
jgi:integrase